MPNGVHLLSSGAQSAGRLDRFARQRKKLGKSGIKDLSQRQPVGSNRVVPPNGYSLANVPNFLRPTAAQMTVQIQPPNGIDVARVTSTNPNVIQVNQPDQFGQPQLNHEVTHGYEDLTPQAPGLPPSAITGIMEPLAAIGGPARVVRR
jgi:hypothetical protein